MARAALLSNPAQTSARGQERQCLLWGPRNAGLQGWGKTQQNACQPSQAEAPSPAAHTGTDTEQKSVHTSGRQAHQARPDLPLRALVTCCHVDSYGADSKESKEVASVVHCPGEKLCCPLRAGQQSSATFPLKDLLCPPSPTVTHPGSSLEDGSPSCQPHRCGSAPGTGRPLGGRGVHNTAACC